MQSGTWEWYLPIGVHHITNQKTAILIHQTGLHTDKWENTSTYPQKEQNWTYQEHQPIPENSALSLTTMDTGHWGCHGRCNDQGVMEEGEESL